MKYLITLTIICSFVFISSLNFAQEKGIDKSGNDIKKKVEELESKLDKQKREIDSLQTELKKLKSPKPMVAIPAPKDFKKYPKGATPFEFNGHTYYIVPLEKNGIKNENELLKK